MSYTKQLHQLQQVDSRLLATAIRLKQIAASLVESDALKTARTGYEAAEATYKQTKAAVTDLELEVQGLQQRIEQNEKRLYSGSVTSPKEAGSLQEEIDSSKRRLSDREEALLEAMIYYEETEADGAEKRLMLKQVKLEWEADQFDLLQEQENRQAQLEHLKGQRKEAAQFIKKDDLAIYDRLRRRLNGVGLSEVKNGTCQSCGVMLASRVIQQTRADSQLHYCDSCQRIMHVV